MTQPAQSHLFKCVLWHGIDNGNVRHSNAESREYMLTCFWGMGANFYWGMGAWINWGGGSKSLGDTKNHTLDLHP